MDIESRRRCCVLSEGTVVQKDWHPEKVAELKELYERWNEEMFAYPKSSFSEVLDRSDSGRYWPNHSVW